MGRSPLLLVQILLLFLAISLACSPVRIKRNYNRIIFKNGIADISVEEQLIKFLIRKDDGTEINGVFRTKVADKLLKPSVSRNCTENAVCIEFKPGDIDTIIQAYKDSEIIKITRNAPEDGELTDCYEFGEDIQWFGGPQFRYQKWPIQNMYYEDEPYVPTHPLNMAVTERYWLNSKGIYITVNDTVPLFLDQNHRKDKHLCFIAKNKIPYENRLNLHLNYEIGVFPTPRKAHESAVKNKLGKPTKFPNERMIQHPIWSTWARYKANVSEEVVRTFADEILAHNFTNSQLEIDDNWETCYGSAEFDKKKFPNITMLITDLKKKGFKVTLWIHPFINEGCEPAYKTAYNNSYFVKNFHGKVHTQWWQGPNAAVIDFTNPKAVAWWVGRLKKLQALGIDSFKFDAGEVSWLPEIASLSGNQDLHPGIFTHAYVSALAKNFDDAIEVRVGWKSQNLPIFVRMIDKDTSWSWNNGLPTLITTLIQMNLNGYVFVLPDMIGGNGYLDGSLNGTIYPSKELFIRWLQATTFMPSLQFSFVPWDFDDETIELSRECVNMHIKLKKYIMRSMNESIESGAPLNPPIWWIDSTNNETYKINDEFLLGESVLIAPVLEEGVDKRDIYLPNGKWLDIPNNELYPGRTWIRDYKAPLNILPFFVNVENSVVNIFED